MNAHKNAISEMDFGGVITWNLVGSFCNLSISFNAFFN